VKIQGGGARSVNAHAQQSLLHEEKKNLIWRVASFIAKIYDPTFLQVHFKPQALDDPENEIFYFRFSNMIASLLSKLKRCLTHAETWLETK